jgi:hypothetical protein
MAMKELVWEFRERFRRSVSSEPARLEPFNLEVPGRDVGDKEELSPTAPFGLRNAKSRSIFYWRRGIIAESRATYYSQVLMVPKPGDKWRLCIDFTNLNEATTMANS